MGLIYKALILSPRSKSELQIFNSGYLVVSDEGEIEDISENDLRPDYEGYDFKDYSKYLICPGFVDVHNHLPQYAFAGIGEKALLPWLEKYTFPREGMFEDDVVAKSAAEVFFDDLIKNGTTTTCTYATIHKSATDIAFECAEKSGIRAVIGKVMMDQNSPKKLTESVEKSVKESLELMDKWHGREGRLFYSFTPRFAISCSWEMLNLIGEIVNEKDVYVQSHLSENQDEIEFVRKLFPQCENYTDVYYRAGIMGEKTIMAHCVYLDGDEMSLIEETKTKVAHCPTSNRFLGSGIMPFRKYEKRDWTIGLGTDVAGGYSLSMFNEMKEAIENSKYVYLFSKGKEGSSMTVVEAFYLATLGGAKVLSMENEIGSLEKGKKADFLVIDYMKTDSMHGLSGYQEPEQVLSKLIYRGGDAVVKEVYVDGVQIKKNSY